MDNLELYCSFKLLRRSQKLVLLKKAGLIADFGLGVDKPQPARESTFSRLREERQSAKTETYLRSSHI